jgi:RimJ/RimL family protein N-acetyltransferase
VLLRAVEPEDLPVFFEQQLDPEANRMAAFTAADPSDREAFAARWARILAGDAVAVTTILADDGAVAGSVLLWRDPALDGPEVSYWLGREFWGRGLATAALRLFLAEIETRPLYGRAAKDNVASIRVLEKCGFALECEARGYAPARGEEIAEVVLRLDA